MKSAIEATREKLYEIQNAMKECETEEGCVKTWMRERYLILLKEELSLKTNLDWLIELSKPKALVPRG